MIRPSMVWECRHKLGISEYVLARMLGVQEATVSEWEQTRGPILNALPCNEQLLSAIARAADKARRPHALGHAMVAALTQDGPAAALYLALHVLHHRHAPARNQSPTKPLPFNGGRR